MIRKNIIVSHEFLKDLEENIQTIYYHMFEVKVVADELKRNWHVLSTQLNRQKDNKQAGGR